MWSVADSSERSRSRANGNLDERTLNSLSKSVHSCGSLALVWAIRSVSLDTATPWRLLSDYAIVETTTSYYVPERGGLPAISVEIQTSVQAWKLIERDYTLRLSLVASEWSEEHLKAWNAVFAEGRRRGNSAYWGHALVEVEIADEDKRAEWSYRTCCEIWEVQDRPKCRPFFRAIFESCLQPMFAVRDGCFTHQLKLHHRRTGTGIPQDLSAIGGYMKRERDKLGPSGTQSWKSPLATTNINKNSSAQRDSNRGAY